MPKLANLLSVIIALVALVFSVVSFLLSYDLSRRSAITGIKPVLVFEYDGSTGWILGNVGNGPALNVLVAQKKVSGGWFNPVRVPPLAAESSFVPAWLGHVNTTGLGATYTDIDGREYSSVTGNDLTTISDGKAFGPWSEVEIGKHWDQPLYRED
jgi:hypothetical protein